MRKQKMINDKKIEELWGRLKQLEKKDQNTLSEEEWNIWKKLMELAEV